MDTSCPGLYLIQVRSSTHLCPCNIPAVLLQAGFQREQPPLILARCRTSYRLLCTSEGSPGLAQPCAVLSELDGLAGSLLCFKYVETKDHYTALHHTRKIVVRCSDAWLWPLRVTPSQSATTTDATTMLPHPSSGSVGNDTSESPAISSIKSICRGPTKKALLSSSSCATRASRSSTRNKNPTEPSTKAVPGLQSLLRYASLRTLRLCHGLEESKLSARPEENTAHYCTELP